MIDLQRGKIHFDFMISCSSCFCACDVHGISWWGLNAEESLSVLQPEMRRGERQAYPLSIIHLGVFLCLPKTAYQFPSLHGIITSQQCPKLDTLSLTQGHLGTLQI